MKPSQLHQLQRDQTLSPVLEPDTVTEYASNALLIQPHTIVRNTGLKETSCGDEFTMSPNMVTAKHVDDTQMMDTNDGVDRYVKCVDTTSGLAS